MLPGLSGPARAVGHAEPDSDPEPGGGERLVAGVECPALPSLVNEDEI